MPDFKIPEAFASSVVLAIKSAVAPILERLAAAEARIAPLSDVRDRVLAVEVKAAQPAPSLPLPVLPEPVDLTTALAPVHATLAAVQDQVKGFEARWSDLSALRERVAVVESKVDQPVPTVLRDEPDLSPVLERLAATEARLSVLGDLRDRVVTVETKAAMPLLEATRVDLAPVLERLAGAEARLTEVDKYAARVEGYTSFLQRDTAALSERIALVETRPFVPGPQGEPGPAGKDGIDGKDGAAGLEFQGVYQDGKSYECGHLVTWAGSSWHCNEPTTTKPGDGSKAWTLMVKRGRDGKDGTAGADGKPGRDLTEKAAWQR